MIEEEYRGYILTAVRRSGMWEVIIYPLSVGQIVPKPRGRPLGERVRALRQAAQAVAREGAFIEARRRVDALLAARAVLKRGAWPPTAVGTGGAQLDAD